MQVLLLLPSSFPFFHIKPSGCFWLLTAPFLSQLCLHSELCLLAWDSPFCSSPVAGYGLWFSLASVCSGSWWSARWKQGNSKGQELAGGAGGEKLFGKMQRWRSQCVKV